MPDISIPIGTPDIPFQTGQRTFTGKFFVNPGVPGPFSSLGSFLRAVFQGTGATQQQASQSVSQLKNIFGNPFAGKPSSNLSIATGGIVATTGLIAVTATNPGVQQTIQSNSGALKSLADALKNTSQAGSSFSSFLTQNPLFLLAIIGVGAILVIKK